MADLSGLRVLIVDDNEVNRRVLHGQITSWHMRNGSYAGATQALEALREARLLAIPTRLCCWITRCRKWMARRWRRQSRPTRC